MIKTTIPIKGMHCRSCEILIAEKLREIPEVEKIHSSYQKKHVIVYSKKSISDEVLNAKIAEAGYEVGVEKSKNWFSSSLGDYNDILISIVILAVLYLLAKSLGLFSISINSQNPSNLFVVILVGLTAGFSSCMAVVGGLLLGISAKHAELHPEATPVQKFRPHIFFNIGRIASYFLLGGVIGLVGKAFRLSGPSLGILSIIVGLVMLTVGLQLTGLFPRLSNVSFSLPPIISKLFGIKKHHNKEYSHLNSALVGGLTFFMPCGFTQSMQLYAMSTGSFWSGALIMGVFALGTAPGLLSIGGLTAVAKGPLAKRFFKTAGVLVVALAVLNISNGLNLTGISPVLLKKTQSQNASEDPNVKIENGVQIVRMDQTASGYFPNHFTIKQGLPVKWIITSKDQTTCAGDFYSKQLNIRQFLKAGENTFNFTPSQVGTITFSCSMGMYRGSFDVVANDNVTAVASPASPSASPSPETSPSTVASKDEQVIKATYSRSTDISPREFNVKAGKPVRFEVSALDDGSGCMSSITIPKLVQDFDYLEKGKTIVFNFTPSAGSYYITCAMGTPRGIINAT
jgi:sulfite exporter TauE/SafE/plastocyanin domain-containing protein/copper chaperone CopZ